MKREAQPARVAEPAGLIRDARSSPKFLMCTSPAVKNMRDERRHHYSKLRGARKLVAPHELTVY